MTVYFLPGVNGDGDGEEEKERTKGDDSAELKEEESAASGEILNHK